MRHHRKKVATNIDNSDPVFGQRPLYSMSQSDFIFISLIATFFFPIDNIRSIPSVIKMRFSYWQRENPYTLYSSPFKIQEFWNLFIYLCFLY